MGAMTTVQVRVGVEVQKRAAEVLEREGLTIEQAVERMLERTAEEGTLPFASDGAVTDVPGDKDAAYDAWFRTQVQEALADDSPGIPHEEVEAEWAKEREELLKRVA
jgi:DNA-damage-inducible protein J